MKLPSDKKLVQLAREVFCIEIAALEGVSARLNSSFADAVRSIYECKSKVVVTGMGKSGIIARKLAATFCSTGTLAIYMHPAEALHGDLGVVVIEDVVIMIGKSGESDENLSIIPVLKKTGCKIISITGNKDSTLARNSDIVLDTFVSKEACSLNLAPTSSTTAALVMGDALSTVVSRLKKFREEDFAMYHPGGTLGKRLLLKVSDFLHPLEETAVCCPEDDLRSVLIKMSEKNLGAALIIKNGKLKGIISDGDIKRILTKYKNIDPLRAEDIMTPDPKTIDSEMPAFEALKIMKQSGSFSVMPVLNDKRPAGLVRLHDLLRSGL